MSLENVETVRRLIREVDVKRDENNNVASFGPIVIN